MRVDQIAVSTNDVYVRMLFKESHYRGYCSGQKNVIGVQEPEFSPVASANPPFNPSAAPRSGRRMTFKIRQRY